MNESKNMRVRFKFSKLIIFLILIYFFSYLTLRQFGKYETVVFEGGGESITWRSKFFWDKYTLNHKVFFSLTNIGWFYSPLLIVDCVFYPPM